MDVRFVDTTLRDGQQSLWALAMRYGMIDAVAEDMDRAGFDAVEVPILTIYVKKFVRDLKEDPWEVARMVARKMPNTVKTCIGGAYIDAFGARPPRSILNLFFTRLVETGALNRIEVVSNTIGQIKGPFPWFLPMMKELGVQTSLGISYSISPRHTDDYYAETTRQVVRFNPDRIYLKDQCGLLTVDRLRTLLPVILQNAGDVPVELHAHCNSGLAPLVYLEALRIGVRTLHTAIPPLANGWAQPSVFNIASNARLMGFKTQIDETRLRAVSARLLSFARQEKLPIGAPLEYDQGQYVHQVPGGVISNLKHQLRELGIQHRLDEVLEETVRVRQDLGYPIMITPHSQFVVTQSAINVALGERYKVFTDELVLFALGVFGEDSGYPWMNQNLRDKLLSSPRAQDLRALTDRQNQDIPLKEIRDRLGGASVSDEEFLLRYIMKGEEEIRAMRAAGPPKKYFTSGMPLLTLMQELDKHKQVRYVHIQRGGDSFVIQKQEVC